AADLQDPVPVSPVAVRLAALRQAGVRSGGTGIGAVADHARQRRLSGRQRQLRRTRRAGILGTEDDMSPTLKPPSLGEIAAEQGEAMDQRYHLAAGVKRQINKVFPSHWSFLLGEIALYSFIVLLLTGVYLTLFFDPSMTEVVYHGAYQPLNGIEMSRAYESALNISFEVRGGLFVRQIHHWAALLFAAAIMVHLARIFFTGAFRKPREANWVIGSL